MEAEDAWAGNEPAFTCVQCFLEYVSMFPFCTGSGNGELCLWSRTSAWQTLHCTKISDSLKIWRCSSGAAGDTFHPYRLDVLSQGWQLTWGCYNSNIVLPTLFPLVNFWEGETFGSKCSAIPESQDHCWLALYRGCAQLREWAFPYPCKELT